jgi:hypothetical protein
MDKDLIVEALEVAINSYEYDGEKEKVAAIKKRIETMKGLITNLKELHKKSFATYSELNNANDDDNYDEDYADTLTRKYEEGYSDALSMVIQLLEETN